MGASPERWLWAVLMDADALVRWKSQMLPAKCQDKLASTADHVV